jgi:hypothetical protein
MTISSTSTYTKTITPTFTSTGTPSATPTQSMGKPVLCPVPVPRNGNLCLFPDKPYQTSHWDVYDWVGVSIASLNFGGGNACWNVQGVPPGIYIVRIKMTYLDGSSSTTWQKIVVSL